MAKKIAKVVKKAPKKAAVKKTAKVAVKAKPKAKASVKAAAKPAAKKSTTATRKMTITLDKLYELVEKRAYEMFLERGCSHGEHQGDWYLAEKELRAKVKISND